MPPVRLSGLSVQARRTPVDRLGDGCHVPVATRYVQFGEPIVMTYLLAWCAVSVIGTWIALALIKTGKRREPEADRIQMAAREIHSTAATHLER